MTQRTSEHNFRVQLLVTAWNFAVDCFFVVHREPARMPGLDPCACALVFDRVQARSDWLQNGLAGQSENGWITQAKLYMLGGLFYSHRSLVAAGEEGAFYGQRSVGHNSEGVQIQVGKILFPCRVSILQGAIKHFFRHFLTCWYRT